MNLNSFFRGKNVFVAGASGFVGFNLANRLLELGADVCGSFNSSSERVIGSNFRRVQADFLNYDTCLQATRRADVIFICAAVSSGAGVIANNPLSHLSPNVVINTNLLAAAYENNVERVIFLSSNTVYPEADFPVKESDASFDFFHKYYVVSWMKRFTEIMCEIYAQRVQSSMKTIVVRPGNLFGPFDKFDLKRAKVIPALINKAVSRMTPLEVWGDGYDLKDFLYIDDFVEGLLMVSAVDSEHEVFNVASGKSRTVNDVLALILTASSYSEAEVRYLNDMPTMISKRRINIEKIREWTGWEPTTTLEEGIEKTVEWYQRVSQRKEGG